jgi:Ni/Co efflux regulator RcnB
MKRIAFIAAMLVAGTALASAQPGAGYQDRGNREQSIGVHDNNRTTGMGHQAKGHKAKSHKAKSHKAKSHRVARRSTHRTSGRGLPPGGKYQNQKENESEGKTPDGRM